MRRAICLHSPLRLPWQPPPSPRFPTANGAALLKHPCGGGCAANPTLPRACRRSRGRVSRAEQRSRVGRRRGGRLSSAAPLSAKREGSQGLPLSREGMELMAVRSSLLHLPGLKRHILRPGFDRQTVRTLLPLVLKAFCCYLSPGSFIQVRDPQAEPVGVSRRHR